MLKIKKIRADHVLDFAAEELKKYLRMMMPRCGEISISYEPDAKDGFRLGLMEDFGLPCEAEDPVLDDVIHVDVTPEGGILAGSNPRSVLFAVYRLLRENGCRWLYPGVDGEHVPVKDIAATKYHKMADHRFRGHCNEGSESQQCMLDTIDFYAKQELNVYMIEHEIPYVYYRRYYDHNYNESNRPPEPVSYDQVLQWKRQCEVEISKRGLQFHNMGHGWTADPFGVPLTSRYEKTPFVITEEIRANLAMLDGVRRIHNGDINFTNLCMSKPEVRTIMVKSIVEFARTHQNTDYLHVWLSDGSRNHCECEECQKARPSDFYMMIMNELDEALTAAGLDTRIVFIAYVDTLFAPEKVRINNPKRFSLLYAPITRSYTQTISEDDEIPPAPPYVRNKWERPSSAKANTAFLREWQKAFPGPVFTYEYHFWRHQYLDVGGLELAHRIYEDIRSLKFQGVDGFVEDGSQRSFWPNGFAIYIFAEALMNRDCDYEAVLEDYFSHIYGDAWKEVKAYLQKVGDVFDFAYMSGEKPADPSIGRFYDPSRVQRLAVVKELAAEGRAIAKAHLAMPTRPQTISMRMLLRHAEYIEGVAEFMIEKAQGHDQLAKEYLDAFLQDFGKYEFEMERYYDHGLVGYAFDRSIINHKSIIL